MNTNDRALSEAKNVAAKLASLVGDERKVLVAFLRHLIEFDQKRHYAKLGHGSLFAYCTDELRLSIGSTSRRLIAARLMAKYPVIADFLADGRLTLVSLSTLRNVLTQENHLEVLREAGRRTEKEVEVLVATLQPKPDTVDSIRKLPTPKAQAPTLSMDLASAPAPRPPTTAAPTAVVPATSTVQRPTVTSIMEVKPGKPEARRAPRMEVHPTSAEAYSVRLSVSREFVDEFKLVQAALSHKFPNGRFEDVLRECFRITLEAVERRRFGSPRSAERAVAPATFSPRETRDADMTVAAPKGAALATAQVKSRVASGARSSNESRQACMAVDAREAAPLEATEKSALLASATGASNATPSASADAIVAPADQASNSVSKAVAPRAIAACGTATRSRYIPAPIRRAVWERDGGTCAFVSADGKRCGSRHQVEMHHVDPFATGGASTVENLSLRCRLCRMRHNLHYAASLLMPRVGGGPTRTSANSRHNQSASRNARRRSVGRYLSLPTSGGAVLASARSFIFRSASRYICVVSTLSWPSQSAMTARSTPDWSRCTAVVWRST